MSDPAVLVRAPSGSARTEEPLNSVQIPDAWRLAEWLEDQGEVLKAKMVRDLWTLCHDLRQHALAHAEAISPLLDLLETTETNQEGCSYSVSWPEKGKRGETTIEQVKIPIEPLRKLRSLRNGESR